MKILLVTQNFYPENFKSNDIAFELVKKGYDVEALVGIPNYPEGKYYEGYGIFRKRVDKINGVKIYRAFQSPRGSVAGIFGLSLNYLTFVLSACIWAFFLALFKRYSCVLVHQTSPVTQAIPAIIVKKIRRIPLYTWVLDLWPDALKAGSGIENRNILAAANRVVRFIYDHSDKILISSKGFAELIVQKGAYNNKLVYYPNWADDLLNMHCTEIPPLPKGFIIMMAGNLGRTQRLDAVMRAVLELRDIPFLKWVFIGDGNEKNLIEEFAKKNNMEGHVYTLGRFPPSAMPAFFKAANAMLLSLKADYPHHRAVVPARLQSYMAAGRPVLAMVEGGAAKIIREANCGYVVNGTDYISLADVIRNNVLTDIATFEKLGQNGRKYFEENYTKDVAIDRLIRIIEKTDDK